MISHLHIRGLGPHDDLHVDVSPRGWTTVSGHSRAGKSTLMDAACFVLWGEDRTGSKVSAEQLRDGSCSVEMTLASGTTFRRSLTVSEGGARRYEREKVDRDGIAEDYKTEKAWTEAALGVLGRDTDLIRLVMVPMQWQRLELGEGEGRPLRDAVLRATAGAAVDRLALVSELMGEELPTSTATDEGLAKAQAASARKALERAETMRDSVRQGLAAARARTVEEPASELVLEAAAAVEAWPAWTAYDRACETREHALARAGAHAAMVQRWRAAVDALGAAPPDVAGELARAVEEVVAAEDRLREAERATVSAIDEAQGLQLTIDRQRAHVGRRQADLADQAHRLTAVEDATGDTCPTCGRDGWHDGAERAAAAVESARAAMEGIRRSLEESEASLVDLVAALAATEERRDALDTAHTEAAEALASLRKRSLALARARDEHDAWHRQRRALGEEPTAPGVPPAPAPPDGTRPTMPLADARRILSDRDRAAGALEQIARDVGRLTTALADSEAGVVAAEARVDRAERLVEAVRRAPTIALERQLGALGDLGPVSLRPRGIGGLALLVDGRPWQLASDGELVAADLAFRAGLRRAMGLSWLPLFVDRAQDVGGLEWPDVAGPVVALLTTHHAWSVELDGRDEAVAAIVAAWGAP